MVSRNTICNEIMTHATTGMGHTARGLSPRQIPAASRGVRATRVHAAWPASAAAEAPGALTRSGTQRRTACARCVTHSKARRPASTAGCASRPTRRPPTGGRRVDVAPNARRSVALSRPPATLVHPRRSPAHRPPRAPSRAAAPRGPRRHRQAPPAAQPPAGTSPPSGTHAP